MKGHKAVFLEPTPYQTLKRPRSGSSLVGRQLPNPLRVLKPRVLSTVHRAASLVGRFGLVLLLGVGILLLPTPPGLSEQGHRALAAFVFTASLLALQPAPLPIAALMIPVALVAFRVADGTQAFETFSRPVVFLVLGSLFIAEALRKHGVTRRLALHAIILSGGSHRSLLFAVMLVTAMLSMWIENTATAAMMIPVAMTVSSQLKESRHAQEMLILLVLGIAYAASVGGMVTVTGSAANAVAASHLAQARSFTFLDWMRFGGPAFLVVFPLSWYSLTRLRRVDIPSIDIEPIRIQLKELGPIGRMEKEVLMVLGATILLWAGGAYIEPLFGLPPSLLSAAMVGILAVAYMALRHIIMWDDLKDVSWGIFFIIGAGLALGEAVVRAGVPEWIAMFMGPWVGGAPLIMVLLVLVFASAILTNVLNNTTIAAVFVPILMRVADDVQGADALLLVMPVTLATTFGYSLPSASGRMALIAATGIVGPGVMFRYGVAVMAVSSLAVALLFYGLSLVGWI